MKESIVENIINSNHRREELSFSKFACFSRAGNRRNPEIEKIPDEKNIRPVFFHDTDKIIHSKAYSRYMDKTQVFALFENDHITHRAMHVQLVAKIARTIGRCLSLNEDLIEAISLGHDIGHAPFGHDGEKILNNICIKHNIGCFSHNVQGVRTLCSIENKGKGLNLSLQVLDGILSHNGEIFSENYHPVTGKTWDDFDIEYTQCLNTADCAKKFNPMTLEGCVVRMSDIIAYVGKDIEDAITVNLLQREDIPLRATSVLGNSNNTIINGLVTDLIENSHGKDYISFSDTAFGAMMELVRFNYENIYFNAVIKRESKKVENMFSLIFDNLLSDHKANGENSYIYNNFIEDKCEEYVASNPTERMIVDFMAGMTDNFIIHLFNEFFFPKNFGYYL